MNDLQKRLETVESTIEALQSYAEDIRSRIAGQQIVGVKQWSPVGGGWFVDGEGDVVKSFSSDKFKEFGHERPTQQQAERAAVEMRKFNRLLALRDELCGDDVVDWESKTSDKWKVYRDNRDDEYRDDEWIVDKNQYKQNVGVYFTKEEHAQRACDMLNSGEVVL
jgi:hypothetical protein